jgi:hypothetical protein
MASVADRHDRTSRPSAAAVAKAAACITTVPSGGIADAAASGKHRSSADGSTTTKEVSVSTTRTADERQSRERGDGRDERDDQRDDARAEYERADGDEDFPRSWDWAVDGELYGAYRELRVVETKLGPRPLVELKLVDSGEVVTVWLTAAVLHRKFAEELTRRLTQGAEDFQPGEKIRIRRGEKRPAQSGNGSYWPFQVEFEFAAKLSAKEILLAEEEDGEQAGGDGESGVQF